MFGSSQKWRRNIDRIDRDMNHPRRPYHLAKKSGWKKRCIKVSDFPNSMTNWMRMRLTINYPAFHSAYFTRSGAKFKMADESFVLVDQLTEDFDLENELFDDKDDIMVFSAVSCFMRRDLNRIDGYFEVTVPNYEPNEFLSHFQMTRGTCEILCLEVMNIARIPAGGRQLIPPTKQVLAFLWSMANQELTRLIAERFNITMSSINRVLQIGTQALADLNAEYIKWPNGTCIFFKQ